MNVSRMFINQFWLFEILFFWNLCLLLMRFESLGHGQPACVELLLLASFSYCFETEFWNDCRPGEKRIVLHKKKVHHKSVSSTFSAKSPPWEKAFCFASIMQHNLQYLCTSPLFLSCLAVISEYCSKAISKS